MLMALLLALMVLASVERYLTKVQFTPIACYAHASSSHQHPGIGGDRYYSVTIRESRPLILLPPLLTV